MTEQRVRRTIEVVAVGAAMATTAVLALGPVPTVVEWSAAIFFTAFGLVASGLGYRTSQTTIGTIGFLPFLSIALLSPNVAAVLSVVIGVVGGELIARKPLVKLAFNVFQQAFAQALAILVFLLLDGKSLLTGHAPLHAFVAMVAVFMVVNKLAVSSVVAASSDSSTREHWLRSLRGSALYDLLAFPLIYFFAFAYATSGPYWSAGLALPMLGLRQLYKSNFALQKINEELLQLMVASIEARDPYTSGHSQRVARYARIISRAAGLHGRAVERTVIAALLHDVGKIHEEFAEILRKPGALTNAEFDVMKTHPARSAELVRKVSQFSDLVPSVLAHHEAWNGRGYPANLKGGEIPIGARVIALADTIDAMTTSRPYRNSLNSEQVRAEIARESGHQFDPQVCIRLLSPPMWAELTRELAAANADYPANSGWDEQLVVGRTGEYSSRTNR